MGCLKPNNCVSVVHMYLDIDKAVARDWSVCLRKVECFGHNVLGNWSSLLGKEFLAWGVAGWWKRNVFGSNECDDRIFYQFCL